MIRAVCPESAANLKTGFVTGWNLSPNVAYTLTVYPGASSGMVLVFNTDQSTLLASGLFMTGTDQPVVLMPQSGQTVGMLDDDLGYHFLMTTTGSESTQTIRYDPFVDGPDQVAAIYSVDDLAIAQATAAIFSGTHYTDEVSIFCPLGLVGWLGDIVAATVHGESMVGDIESISFQAGPSSMADVVTIRRMSAILPDAPVVIVPPVVVDDAAETDAVTATSGNVLTNDASGLTVVAVDGLMSNVGIAVAGSAGGVFTITANGAWTFDPDGDFATLSGSDTATTSVTYHASNGQAEAMATLTVTVSGVASQPWTPAEIATALWLDAADATTITLSSGAVSQWSDKSGHALHVTQGTDSMRPTLGTNSVVFAGSHWLQNATAQLPLAEFVLAVVFKETAAVANAGVLSIKGSGYDWNSTNGLVFGASNKTTARCICIGSTSASFELKDTTSPSGPCPLAVYTVEKSAIVGSFYRDGNLLATDSAFTAFASTSIGGVVLGARQTPALSSPYLKGEIMEIVYAQVGCRHEMEGYLAHKWGLAANLPSDHPFKSTAPTV